MTPLRPRFLWRLAPAVVAAASVCTGAARAAPSITETYGGREMIVHVPDHLPPEGARGLVVVLHGGLGNALVISERRAESGLNLDAAADRNGFVVAYLNGTPVTRMMGAKFLGWNAGGGCCGVPARTDVDDVAYITGAVGDLARRYGIDRKRVFAIGHSNGAMMAQRLVCETHLLAAAVAVSGPLNLPVDRCPAAKGARVLALHGAADENVPVAGGKGAKGVSGVVFQSEARSKAIMTRSGADYRLEILEGADHRLDHIDAALEKADGVRIPDKAAQFFGLEGPSPAR